MKPNISTKYLLLALLLFCSHEVFGQKRSISFGNSSPSSISMGAYEPRSFKSLDALPANIRLKVENHLRERFGSAYYSKLAFVSGAVINLNELYRVEPAAKNYQWKIHSYELVFRYADPKKGLKKYYARTRLDSNGDVMDEIGLPEISRYPQKANIISVDKAIEIAKEHGLKPKEMNIRIQYDEGVGSLVWIISSFAGEDKYTSTDRVIRIDAHSAEILKDGYEGGIK